MILRTLVANAVYKESVILRHARLMAAKVFNTSASCPSLTTFGWLCQSKVKIQFWELFFARSQKTTVGCVKVTLFAKSSLQTE